MIRGDDEIAALLADMEQKQYGSVSTPAAVEHEEQPIAEHAHLQDADTRTLLRAEISRHFAFQEIKAKFDLLCAELRIQPDRNIFIRWLLKMKYLERGNTAEPLIPVMPRSSDGNLLDEFKKLGVDKGKINWFAQDLSRWAAKSHSKFVYVMEKASSKKVRVKLVEQTDGYVLQCSRASVNVSKAQYKKLRSLYFASNAHFHDRLFLTLMRYKSLQGKILPSLPERCKAVLSKHLSIDTECYTTPLLTTTQRYCSLFADTDMCFGSSGNFIMTGFDEGSFLVHPPVVHEIIDAACDHMNRMLGNSMKPMSFAVIIPCWDARGVANIRNSEYARMIVETEERDDQSERFHQHSGPAPAQLVILQNEAGAAAWPVSEKLHEEFLQAYQNKRSRRNSDASVDDAPDAPDAPADDITQEVEMPAEVDAEDGHEEAAAADDAVGALAKPTKKNDHKKKKRKLAADEKHNREQPENVPVEEEQAIEGDVEEPVVEPTKQPIAKRAEKRDKKRKPLRQR